MHTTKDPILTTAIELTEQDDHLALRQTLIDGVKHSTGVENVSLFEMKVNYDSDKEEREEEGKQAIIYYRNAMDQNALCQWTTG